MVLLVLLVEAAPTVNHCSGGRLAAKVWPVTDDQRPHFVIDILDRVERFNLATDGRKFLCRKYTASENLNGHV